MSDSKRREHICFTGYVQGVGFRYRLSHLAQYYGVTGWVRNEYDGSVSAELQGLVVRSIQILPLQPLVMRVLRVVLRIFQ